LRDPAFRRECHRRIAQILARLDAGLLRREGIGFGGGTRIAMELDEYRESVDIDLICPSTASFRAVRETVSDGSLGALARLPMRLAREVRTTRDKVVTAVELTGQAVKLEVICFADWDIGIMDHPLFPVPVLNRTACFATKLAAANDRGRAPPYKDVVDLIVMRAGWGEFPTEAVKEAERHYGKGVLPKAEAAIAHFLALPDDERQRVARSLGMQEDCFDQIAQHEHRKAGIEPGS